MTYYILLDMDSVEDIWDDNILGEESFGTFYTGNGFVALNNIVMEKPELLESVAKEKKLTFVNEVGLDPGIDHFFTHLLVDDLNQEQISDINVSYKSYCGGIPAQPNEFKYKFSWSPLGVLKALNNPAEFIEDFKEKKILKPFEHITNYKINGETFESYPNRNSLPYIKEYMFPNSWNIKQFVRGTLRLDGWKNAWGDIKKDFQI